MIIGIDPGLTGAIAFLHSDGDYLVEDLPTMANGKGTAKVKRQIDPGELANIIRLYVDESAKCYLERVTSMPGQGVSSMFSMGDTFGAIRATLAILKIPTEVIPPNQWKRHYNLGKDKEICRAKAIELFPSESLGRKKDHNRAEALLIANYGRKVENG